jgi:hypothetical protein
MKTVIKRLGWVGANLNPYERFLGIQIAIAFGPIFESMLLPRRFLAMVGALFLSEQTVWTRHIDCCASTLVGMSNMSLRTELVRLCLLWFMRPRFPPDVRIEDVRRRMGALRASRSVPTARNHVIQVDPGGVRAERITTPRSLHNRYILHLHGGAYLFAAVRS